MKHLLDTCVISDFVKGRGKVGEKLKSCHPNDVCFSAITLYEIYYGLEHNPDAAVKLKPMIQGLIEGLTILPFTSQIALHAASIRAYLRSEGKPIGSYDILIAATAIAHDLVLVSSNTEEFSRVPAIQLTNWRD